MSQNTPIKALILDVDGVLTDGKIYFDNHGNESKVFHTQDGFGLKRLQKHGIILGIISGRSSFAVTHRMRDLQIEHVHQGIHHKLPVFQQLLESLKLSPQQVAYVGDDLPDLEIMQTVGLALTVANAVPAIKRIAHYTSQRCGGEGAVREICDWLLTEKIRPQHA